MFPDDWQGYDTHSVATNPSAATDGVTYFVDLSRMSATWWANVKSDGGDIRPTKEDNTQLPCDLIAFDHTAQTGFLAVRFFGSKATSNELLRIWCGNTEAVQPNAAELLGQHDAYDEFWFAFYPFGGAEAVDRTRRANDLTLVGLPAEPTDALVTGPIGASATNWRTVDTSNNYGTANTFVPDRYPVTLICVAAMSAAQSIDAVGLYTAALGNELRLQASRNGTPVLQSQIEYTGSTNQNGASSTIAADANFHHYAGRAASSTLRAALLDGANKGTNTNTSTLTGLDQIVVGKGSRAATSSSSFNGSLSLVQYHSVARSDAWIAYQAAMLNQATFFGTWVWHDAQPVSTPAPRLTVPVSNFSQARHAIDSLHKRIDDAMTDVAANVAVATETTATIQRRLISLGVRLAEVTTWIPPASSTTVFGTGEVQLINLDDPQLDDAAVPCFNNRTDIIYPEGAIVPVVLIGGDFFVVPSIAASYGDLVTATFTSAVSVGQPVYVDGDGSVDLADASALATAKVAGLTFHAAAAGATGGYLTRGRIDPTLIGSDWTTATGSAELTPGAQYYLSTTVGELTTTAPTAGGDVVAPVGIALSVDVLLIEIQSTILL